jgi:hypothetical protein
MHEFALLPLRYGANLKAEFVTRMSVEKGAKFAAAWRESCLVGVVANYRFLRKMKQPYRSVLFLKNPAFRSIQKPVTPNIKM